MAVYRKGDKYMGSVGSGDTARARKVFDTEAAAIAWVAEQTETRRAQKQEADSLIWTLQHAFNQCDVHVWQNKGGARKARLNAGQALAYLGADTAVGAIVPSMIADWMEHLQELGNSYATCNRKLSALNSMLKRAEKFGGLKNRAHVEHYTESAHRLCFYTDTDEVQMLDACEELDLPDLRDFLVVGLDTGMRRSELLSLEPRDYHKGMLMLQGDVTKNRMPRSILCTQRVRAILALRLHANQRPLLGLTDSMLRQQWDRLRKHLQRDDDPGFIVHALRHTCATRLVSEGTDLRTVMAWMGHARIETTMIYSHFVSNRMQDAVTRLDARNPQQLEAAA